MSNAVQFHHEALQPPTSVFSGVGSAWYGRRVWATDVATGYFQTIQGDSAALQFVQPGQLPGGSWSPAQWSIDSTMVPATAVVSLLIGGEGLSLSEGNYDVWVQVTHTDGSIWTAKIDQIIIQPPVP